MEMFSKTMSAISKPPVRLLLFRHIAYRSMLSLVPISMIFLHKLFQIDSCNWAMVGITRPCVLYGDDIWQGWNGYRQSSEMKPRFSLPFQLFSQRLFCDSERQIPHSGKLITFTPIWIRDHWWSASPPPPPSSLHSVSCRGTENS